MAVWYGFLVFFTLVTLLEGLLHGFAWAMLAVPVMWAWGFGLSHVCFWRPMNRARRDLCRLLNGEIRAGSKDTE